MNVTLHKNFSYNSFDNVYLWLKIFVQFVCSCGYLDFFISYIVLFYCLLYSFCRMFFYFILKEKSMYIFYFIKLRFMVKQRNNGGL